MKPDLRWITSLMLLLCVGITGGSACSRAKEGAPHADEHGHDDHHDDQGDGDHDEPARGAGEAQGETEDQADNANVVHIEPAMLRDLRIATARVERRRGEDSFVALGEAAANPEAYAEVSAPLPGRILRLLAAPGDRVARGAPLVELESIDVARARAGLSLARARLDVADRTLSRRRTLEPDRLISARSIEESELERASAASELRALSSTLRVISPGRGDAARFVIDSPIDGVILERSAVIGRMAETTDVLFRIGDLSTMHVVVHAFERDALRVAASATAAVTFPALPGRTFEGRVLRVGSRVEPSSRTLDVVITLANTDALLRPGMSAYATLRGNDDASLVLAVPAQAMQRLADGWVVFLPRGQGSFEIRSVARGRDLGDATEVIQGLAENETIVVAGSFLLKAQAERARGDGDGHHHH